MRIAYTFIFLNRTIGTFFFASPSIYTHTHNTHSISKSIQYTSGPRSKEIKKCHEKNDLSLCERIGCAQVFFFWNISWLTWLFWVLLTTTIYSYSISEKNSIQYALYNVHLMVWLWNKKALKKLFVTVSAFFFVKFSSIWFSINLSTFLLYDAIIRWYRFPMNCYFRIVWKKKSGKMNNKIHSSK